MTSLELTLLYLRLLEQVLSLPYPQLLQVLPLLQWQVLPRVLR